MTSSRIIKAIGLLIVSAFLLVQFASAAHAHDHHDDAPEPAACEICLATSQGDEDWELPPLEPVEPTIISLTMYVPLTNVESHPYFRFEHEKAPEPPDMRPSSPRAPPA